MPKLGVIALEDKTKDLLIKNDLVNIGVPIYGFTVYEFTKKGLDKINRAIKLEN